MSLSAGVAAISRAADAHSALTPYSALSTTRRSHLRRTCGPHIGVADHSCCSRAPNGNCCHGAPRSNRASSPTVSAAKRSSGRVGGEQPLDDAPQRALVDALQHLLGGVTGAEHAERDLLAGVEGVLLRGDAAGGADGAPVVAGGGEVRERARPRLCQVPRVLVGLRHDQPLRHGEEGQRLVAGRHGERRDQIARRLRSAAAADDPDERAGPADQQQAEEGHEPAQARRRTRCRRSARARSSTQLSARQRRGRQFIARPAARPGRPSARQSSWPAGCA